MSTELVQTADVTVKTSTSSAAPTKGKPPLLSPFSKAAVEPPVAVKKAVLVYNPVGGKKRTKRLAETVVVPMLQEAGVSVTQIPTERAGHATEIGRTTSLDGVDALIAMGGDGTLGELLSGVMSREAGAARCALGFIPTGTGNTYMREVLGEKVAGGREPAVRSAVNAILGGHTRVVDAQRCELASRDGSGTFVRYSLNTVMCGFGPKCNEMAERRRYLGTLRYDLTVYIEIFKLPCSTPPKATLTVDGEKSELDLFFFASQNNKFTGTQHRIAPRAQLDDGVVDVVWTPKPVRSVPKAASLDASIKGGGKHVNSSLVAYKQAKSITLEAEKGPQPVMIDGDIVGTTPLKIDVVPSAFTVFAPQSPAPS